MKRFPVDYAVGSREMSQIEHGPLKYFLLFIHPIPST